MTRPRTTLLAVLAVLVVLVGTVPALTVAQSTDRTGGVVVVAEDETIRGDLDAVAGTVIVAGTVTGDADITAGTVVVPGQIDGDLDAVAGSVTLEGTVGGDVAVAGGTLFVRDGATVGGTLEAAAGTVQLEGTVGSNARLAAETVVLGPTASIGGDLEYDAATFTTEPGATVAGAVTRSDDLRFGPGFGVPGQFQPVPPALPSGTVAVYGLLVNLLLGGVLLYVAPDFSRDVAALGTDDSLRSGGFGLVTLVGVPLALVVLFVTIVGIPLSLAGFVAFALVLWVAAVYGAYVLGTWLLSLGGTTHRWGALALGLVVFALLDFVPLLGGLLRFVVLLVGLGAFVLALRDALWSDRDRTAGTTDTGDEPERSPAA